MAPKCLLDAPGGCPRTPPARYLAFEARRYPAAQNIAHKQSLDAPGTRLDEEGLGR